MPNNYLHAMLDTKLQIWRASPSTANVRPFVIIKIVPFSDEWKMTTNLKPIKVKVKKEVRCKINKVRKQEGKPDVILRNRYEVLVDTSTDIIWPEGDEAYNVEIDESAKPETFVTVTKQTGQLRKKDHLLYSKPLQEGTIVIDRAHPNFDEDFPDFQRIIDTAVSKRPIIIVPVKENVIKTEFGVNEKKFLLQTACHDNSIMFKSVSNLDGKDKSTFFSEIEMIKGALATITTEGQNGPHMIDLIVNVSLFIKAFTAKYAGEMPQRLPDHRQIRFIRASTIKQLDELVNDGNSVDD